MQNILFRCDYRLLWQDLSYAFNLGTITERNYTVGLSQVAKKLTYSQGKWVNNKKMRNRKGKRTILYRNSSKSKRKRLPA